MPIYRLPALTSHFDSHTLLVVISLRFARHPHQFKCLKHSDTSRKPSSPAACSHPLSTHIPVCTATVPLPSLYMPCCFCKQIIFCVRCLSAFFGVIFLWCVLLLECITKQITFEDMATGEQRERTKCVALKMFLHCVIMNLFLLCSSLCLSN